MTLASSISVPCVHYSELALEMAPDPGISSPSVDCFYLTMSHCDTSCHVRELNWSMGISEQQMVSAGHTSHKIEMQLCGALRI